jgi:hypothetical protein
MQHGWTWYQETMGIRTSRAAGYGCGSERPDVVILNKALAARGFPGQDAIGKTGRKAWECPDGGHRHQ